MMWSLPHGAATDVTGRCSRPRDASPVPPRARALGLTLALVARAAALPAEQGDDLLVAVPRARAPNPNAVAVIVANGAYQGDLPPVRFAARDARAVERYAREALGVPPGNVLLLQDATLGRLKALFNTQLPNMLRSLPRPADAEVLVYYSGHGAPTVPAGEAYLVPVDANADYLEDTALPLAPLYAQLGRLGARHVTVVLDACFSGQGDQGSLLKGVRPVIRVVQPSVGPTLTVFAAASGTQVSSDFDAKGHGLFTYFFLRGLQGAADSSRDGRITVGELRAYLGAEVPGYARRLRNRVQVPSVITADPGRAVAVTVPLPPGRVAALEATPVVVAPAAAPAPAPAASAPVATPRARRAALTPLRDCASCPELVVLPGGTFRMGSPESEEGRLDDEDDSQGPGGAPVSVALPELAVAIGRTEVTRGQYAAFARATGRRHAGGCVVLERGWFGRWNPKLRADASWQRPGFDQGDDHPVTCVNWDDARAYARWLSQRTGHTYRLPSEAEWEHAARGGTATRFAHGEAEGELCRVANGGDATARRQFTHLEGANACADGRVFTGPAGTLAPNGFGLHDMAGSLWEWTADCYGESYAGTPRDGRGRDGADCPTRVMRGGSWSNIPVLLRPAARKPNVPAYRLNIAGFRVVRELER
ncbi:MAG: SUMF1/EgtB/PvdO family nonheme iron enzyme [Gemmatimonadales bacterium]|nr:SUMF1/EgtB/PvdO family nonheme iron enzyme [Gemmatimonadales bacterium]